ncbi:MAG: cytochrome P460 family protein [Planctomycetes bacterium]|nr:cytochrome P460 family protein [Planctomycetota bacterium]
MRIASGCAALLLAAGCATTPPPMNPQVESAALDYASFGKVDDLVRRAPTLCDAPPPPPPRISASRDPETHGRKLYYLYAKKQDEYRSFRELPQPLGQILVKESWTPAANSTLAHPVTKDRGPLFLMIKTGEADSDAGWIYATATPGGTMITSWGKLASCTECHQRAKNDRVFGLAKGASPQ